MFSIGVVARQTGIEVGTLRKWEQRYGYPRPVRLNSGQRRYRSEDIENLLVIARRLVNGERIGQVLLDVRKTCDVGRDRRSGQPPAKQLQQSADSALAALLRNDLPALRGLLEEARGAGSMADFVEGFAGPLTRRVGECWAGGSLPIFAEHMYSAALESILLREATAADLAGMAPSVLLTTPAGEQHTLGLSMVNAVLCEVGVASVRLHGGLPVSEMCAVVEAYRIKVVGVSATCLYPPKILAASMKAMRNALPPGIELWFGGSGVNKVASIPAGVTTFASMHEIRNACKAIRQTCLPDVDIVKATR